MLLYILLIVAMVLCGLFSIRARQLLESVLWLAGLSVLLSVVLYMLNAPEIAVIELSVGAGLVTVLFVFAIGIAGDVTRDLSPIVPQWLVWPLIIAAIALLTWAIWPAYNAVSNAGSTGTATSYAAALWEVRAGDMLVAIVLILAGVLGMLNLLLPAQESKAIPDAASDLIETPPQPEPSRNGAPHVESAPEPETVPAEIQSTEVQS